MFVCFFKKNLRNYGKFALAPLISCSPLLRVPAFLFTFSFLKKLFKNGRSHDSMFHRVSKDKGELHSLLFCLFLSHFTTSFPQMPWWQQKQKKNVHPFWLLSKISDRVNVGNFNFLFFSIGANSLQVYWLSLTPWITDSSSWRAIGKVLKWVWF